MRGASVFVAGLTLLMAGCSPALFGQTDDFGQKLDRGCSDRRSCDQLVAAANARKHDCAPNTIGKIRCRDAEADFVRALELREASVQRERQASEAATAQERWRLEQQREAERQQREDEQQQQKLAQEYDRRQREAAQENAAWLVLDLDGCAVRGDPRACPAIERFILMYPQSTHLQEAAEKLRAGRAVNAESERRAAEQAAAEEERQRQAEAAREAERRRQAEAARRAAAAKPATQDGGSSARPVEDVKPGRVCCCDGTVSPTCTYVKRGCCSHHGGVCACQ